ncbi:MAG: patatin-like phospholipase family protein, partial [Polaromonas sp.]|nr:patatin-like phospholipase family protein [Polaromonas sp.]
SDESAPLLQATPSWEINMVPLGVATCSVVWFPCLQLLFMNIAPLHFAPSPKPVTLHLALQGGGAHGAFTWGALECLLDEPDIQIGRISGTSAGALNGAALVSGYARGGRSGAKSNLALLWQKASEAGSLMSLFHLPLMKPSMGIWDDAMPLLSPYQTNPLALELLRYLVTTITDVELMRAATGPSLFVNAVNVHTGQARVFGPGDMTVAAVMASACAPLMFPAVIIDGQSYWDGSYAGNPSIWPLYDGQDEADIFMVELTPLHRVETPTTAKNILNRINEIASVNGLRSELRGVQQVNQAGKDIRLHVLSFAESVADAQAEPSTKRTVGPVLFETLRRQGYEACAQWLVLNRGSLGRCATVDIGQRYLAADRSVDVKTIGARAASA